MFKKSLKSVALVLLLSICPFNQQSKAMESSSKSSIENDEIKLQKYYLTIPSVKEVSPENLEYIKDWNEFVNTQKDEIFLNQDINPKILEFFTPKQACPYCSDTTYLKYVKSYKGKNIRCYCTKCKKKFSKINKENYKKTNFEIKPLSECNFKCNLKYTIKRLDSDTLRKLGFFTKRTIAKK